jgi:hypothetical protein
MLTDRIAKASNTAKEINAAGGSAIAVAGDMLDDAYLTELVKKTAEFGNGKIHIIVNNAGYTWDGVIHKVRELREIKPEQNLTVNATDHRQAMGHHHRPPLQRALQADPRGRTILPCQGRRTEKHYQHLLNERPPRKRWTSQLRSRQSRCHRSYKDNREGMGPSVRRSREHSCFRIYLDTVDTSKGGRCFRYGTRWI